MPAYEGLKSLPAGAKPCSEPEWRDVPLPGEHFPTHGQGRSTAADEARRAA